MGLILSLADLNIQNCEKWSLTSETMLPCSMIRNQDYLQMLSTREAELPQTHEGLSMVGMR